MIRRIALLALCLAAAPTFASSFAGTTANSASNVSSDASSDGTSSSSGDDKVVQDARQEAAGFVATAGAVRGARLEAALLHLREQAGDVDSRSDLELARSILAR